MANEAKLLYLDSSAVGVVIADYNVANDLALTKGQLLELKDPRAVSGVSAVGVVCAGIAARDKVANDGRTQIGVYRRGDFDMIASGAITVGSPVMAAGTPNGNYIKSAAGTTASGAAIIGYALETASDAEVINVRLML